MGQRAEHWACDHLSTDKGVTHHQCSVSRLGPASSHGHFFMMQPAHEVAIVDQPGLAWWWLYVGFVIAGSIVACLSLYYWAVLDWHR